MRLFKFRSKLLLSPLGGIYMEHMSMFLLLSRTVQATACSGVLSVIWSCTKSLLIYNAVPP